MMHGDPYAGFGAPVAAADPYAGLGSPVDPYEGLGTPDAPGTLTGLGNVARAAGRQALAGLDVMGALARGASRDEQLAEADRLESQAAQVDVLAPTWTPENRATWATRAKDTAVKLRAKASAMDASQAQQLTSAAQNVTAAGKLPPAEDYAAYQKAEGWEAVKQFLRNPVEIPLNIAVEGAVGSVPAMVAGAAGAVAAGPVGLAAGAGVGSFASEYASTLLETMRERGVNAEDAEALRGAFGDAATMAEARQRGLARGIPVAVFDAISGGLAGRTVAPVAKQGVKQIAKAVAKEVGEQAALGAGGETAGQVSEQLVTTGTVDVAKLKLKDIAAEAIGEIVPGVGQVATGAAVRTPGAVREILAEKKPAVKPTAQADLEAAAAAKGIDLTSTGADLTDEIGASLPDNESRDVLAGRSAEASARDLGNVKPDFGATVQSVQDALLTASATPAQLDALDFQLRVLEERKDKRRLTPDQVNASLANTALFETLQPAAVFPLVSRLSEDSANIAALRAGITAMRGGAQPVVTSTAPAPTAAPENPFDAKWFKEALADHGRLTFEEQKRFQAEIDARNAYLGSKTKSPTLTPEQRATMQADLQERERGAQAQKAQAEAKRVAEAAAAKTAAAEQTARVRGENERLAAIEKTGRDPVTKRIVDLEKVPTAEVAGLNAEAEGLTPARIDAELTRRAREEERSAATTGNRGEELLDVLAEVKLPGQSATLPQELAQTIREGMSARQRMTLVRAGVGELDRTAEALRGRGFAWAKTPADVIDHVQRALRGEKIYAEGSDETVNFARRARPVRTPDAERDRATARWWENFRITAPGVARQFELRFGSAEQLVEEGRASAEDLTGEEEAAAYRKHDGAMRGIIYLFEKALRANTDTVTRINLQHEIGHLFYDTLDAATRASLRALWQREIASKTGPLFDADGTLRSNVAVGVEEEFQEWFAERLAHANDRWAQRRTDAAAKGDGLIRTIAAEFRGLLLRFREIVERVFGREGYDDALLKDFRKFLDQGDRWNEGTHDSGIELAGRFAETGLPFARREQATEAEQKRLAELDEQRTKLRAALARAEEWDEKSVPGIEAKIAEIDRERIPLRKKVQPEAFADGAQSVDAFEASQMDAAPAPEPEQGATGLFETGESTVSAEDTAAKRSQLEASTLRRPVGLGEWLENLKSLFTNFRSAIPELPGGAEGRKFMAFRQGYRMLKSATEFVRKDAEEKVADILEPLMKIGREAVSPARYRELQTLQATRQEQIEAGKGVNPKLSVRIAEIDAELESVPYHLFRKVALYRDLFFRSRLLRPDGEALTLPFGLTAAEVETTLRDLHAKVKASPHAAQINESLRRHYALVKEVRDDLLSRGYIIPEELRNPLYFPHVVLDKTSGMLSRVKLDTAEDFRGYLVKLVGSAGAIESDYLQAMYYHLANVKAHNARQDIVETYWQPYDRKAELVAEAKRENEERRRQGLGPKEWKALLRPDEVIYTVDDRIPVRPEYIINRQVLAEKLGVQLGEGDLQKQLRDLGMAVTLTAEDFQAALAAGEKQVWVVPKPVAKALGAILDREARTAGIAERVLSAPQSLWKRWTLFAPHNVFRYTYGNLVADLEKLFSADPKVFTFLRPAFAEVRAFYDGAKPSADLRAAVERGVLDAVTAGEVTDLAAQQMDRFESFLTGREKFVGMMKRGLGWGVTVNRVREAAFRYAKFKADLERLRAGADPVFAGAYNRDVRAIAEATPEATHYAQAAEISRKTFGDYADISVSGDGLRKYLIPFYSWMEVNFRYHANLFRNLKDMSAGAGAAQIARGAVSGASRILVARSVSGVLLRLALPYAAVALWNNSGDREELEKTLSDEDRRRFHIILGKDAQGRTLVVYAPTALSDVMKWFGGNEFARLAGEYIRGQLTLPQLAHEWITNTPRDVLNNVLQPISPQIKAAMIATTRKQPFPDILNQRSIPDYDLKWAVLGSMVDGASIDGVRRLMDKNYYSAKNFGDWTQQLILQARRRDPEQWGYYATMDRVEAYQAAHGGTVDFGTNNRADAQMLASFRRAIRAADVPAALTFYQKLLDAGYTSERFAASVRSADPLGTLRKDTRAAFVATLSPAEQEDMKNGFKYAARMQAFARREKVLFPTEKASANYRQTFAAKGGRPDVFAGVMVNFADQPDEALDARANQLLKQSLRKR